MNLSITSLGSRAQYVGGPALTLKESNQIVRVHFVSYLEISTKTMRMHVWLSTRREKLCKRLPRSARKPQNIQTGFVLRFRKMKRSNQLKTTPNRTYRYENSPLPYKTKLLNQLKYQVNVYCGSDMEIILALLGT